MKTKEEIEKEYELLKKEFGKVGIDGYTNCIQLRALEWVLDVNEPSKHILD